MSMVSMSLIRSGRTALTFMVFTIPAIALAQPEPETTMAGGNIAPDSAMETVALSVEGINPTSSEDNPGILYILPWQPPPLPGRSRGALDANAPELLEPVDPVALERHQKFQKSLNPALDSTTSLR